MLSYPPRRPWAGRGRALDTILVVGGIGTLGRPVVERLVEDGFAARLLVRDVHRARALLKTDAEAFPGDVTDPGSVERALDGCFGVHISVSGGSDRRRIERVEGEGTTKVAQIAARMGVGRLVFVSGYLTQERFASRHFESGVKLRAEQAIMASGVPYTIFRPTYFMETLPRHVRGKRAVVLGKQRHPLHMVAAQDFARIVSTAFRTPEAANSELYVQGPEAITIEDALRLYCEIVDPGRTVASVPLGLMAVVDRLFMGGRLRRTIELMRLMDEVGEVGDASEANRILGAPSTTLRQWCERRATGNG